MSVIHQLDEKVCNMIAAGEVVLGPESVIKELVENAIDANSTRINIELKSSGLDYIKVIDNGCGMDKDDAKLAFSRHATSKIKNAFDLSSIKTLGFRGEALPSIASVSELTLITKLKDSDIGTKVFLKAGNIVSLESVAANTGTSITVSKLFYNVPARLKYLKSEQTILAKICNLVNKFALAKPNIAFTLTNNDRVLLHTLGDLNYDNIFSEIYGKEITKLMNETEGSYDGMNVKIFFSKPEINRARKNDINLIVNGRYVQSNLVNNAVISAYDTYIPKYRYPICLILLEVDPLLIDINVHPQKLEIKFSLEDITAKFITDTLASGLKEVLAIPEIKEEVKEKIEVINFDDLLKEEPKETVKSNRVNINKEKIYEQKVLEHQIKKEESYLNDVIKDDLEEVKEEVRPKRLPYLEYIGQLAGTYLLFQNEEGLFMLDQHAMQERINYEYYYDVLANPNTDNIELLVPYSIHLTNEEYVTILANLANLEKYGLYLEDMGNNTFFIRKTPLWIKDNYENVIEKIIYFLIEKNTFDIGKVRDSLAKMVACKASIKANSYVSREGAYSLLNELDKCNNPFSCPHGRPVFVKVSLKEIEKMFLRTL